MKRTLPDRHITLKLCALYESLLAEARLGKMAFKIRHQTGRVQDRWVPDTVKGEIRLHDNTTGEGVCVGVSGTNPLTFVNTVGPSLRDPPWVYASAEAVASTPKKPL